MTREEALKKVRGYLTDYLPLEDVDEIDEIMLALEPERRQGKWHVEGFNIWCTNCGFHPTAIEVFNYCPNCGTKMEVEDR